MLKKILLILILTISLNSNFVFAQSNPCYQLVSYENGGRSAQTPLFDLNIFNQPCFELGRPDLNKTGFQFVFDLAVGASVALAVILFTVGAAEGILFQASAREKDTAKTTMTNAVVGLLVVLSIWLVINTINPDLLKMVDLHGIGSLPTRDSGSSGPSGVTGTGGKTP